MTDSLLSPQVFIDAVNTDCNSGFSLPFNKANKRRWMSSYGVSPELCSIIWTRLDPETTIPGGEYKHLMWALYFLRVYGTEEQNRRASGGADEKTFRKWTLLFVEAISFLESSVIIWNARMIGDSSRSLVTIDGTDMPVELSFNEAFFSVKFKHSGFKYEVGVCIKTGYIVWINGPFRCGQNDLNVARIALIGALDHGESAVADGGYRGEDHAIRTPLEGSEIERRMQATARSRHETVNERLKIFNVLGPPARFRHTLSFHSSCFRAVAVITQLSFENGSPPFQVEFHEDG